MSRRSVLPALLWFSLQGCSDADTVEHSDTGTSPADTDTTPPLSWTHALPLLDATEGMPAHPLRLWLVGAPPAAEVTFWRSDLAMGDGPCDGRYVNCAKIRDPYLFGTAIADEDGYAEYVTTLGAEELPAPLFFAAQVFDAAAQTGIWTDPISRYVSVPPEDASVAFTAVTAAAGIDLYTTGNSHTGGVAWPDLNGDLLPDLIIGNGSGYPHRVFFNNGDGTFTGTQEVLRKLGLAQEDAQPAFADIDNDGDVDVLFVVDSPFPMDSETVQPLEGGPNALYVNQGDGTFIEDAEARGVVDPRGWRNIAATWSDFDADGFVDLYLATWAMNQPGNDRFGRLLLNDGTGHFVDSGLQLGYGRDVLTLLSADTDVDGWSELYLGHVNRIVGYAGSNPLADDVFYDNVGFSFTDVTAASPGVGDDDWASMGIDVGDVDNDGDFDYYQTDRFLSEDPLPRGNTFYLNNGDDTYTDNVCDVAKICTGYAGWPTGFADFDRDGWVDLWVGTGKDYAQDLLFVNNRDGTFTSNAVLAFLENATRGGAQADYDGDGDVDLAMWNLGDQSELFSNVSPNHRHWVELKLVGRAANREAIGAVVRLSAPGLDNQLRRVSGGDSAHSQSSSIVHFGLGNAFGPVDLEITWPGGSRQTVTGVPIDRIVVIDQADGVVAEQIVSSSALYTAAEGTLALSVRTNYGGRSDLGTAYGDLTWDPATLTFVGAFAVDPAPDTVEVTSAWGGPFALPVVALP